MGEKFEWSELGYGMVMVGAWGPEYEEGATPSTVPLVFARESVERFSPWGTDLTQVFFKSGGDSSMVVMSFDDFLERYMDQAPTLPGYETL